MTTYGGGRPPQLPTFGSFSAGLNNPPRTLIGAAQELAESVRHRQSWNDRFEHWERPESDTEYDRIIRARDMVQGALADNNWLNAEGCRLCQQGSFTNRTNTRGESDIDLRVQHRHILVEYADGVDRQAAYAAAGYFSPGGSFRDKLTDMRAQIVSDLQGTFGRGAVDASGKKAIRVKGLEGSRAEVDVVPAFRLHFIEQVQQGFMPPRFITTEGVALLDTIGGWTYNFPDQHIANGRDKRSRTGHQFKKVVRTIKRMQRDMMNYDITDKRVPSFLVECLVYLVEDEFFTVPGDDRYGRIKRVLQRVNELINGPNVGRLLEINDRKFLFHPTQGWQLNDAQEFVALALAHLGDA
jgi:hypothetical protein